MSDSEAEEDKEIASGRQQIKIVFVGEPSVGKTSVIRRLCYDEFTRQYTATVGADFYIKRLTLPGRRDVTLKISDIGGLELRGSMLDKYLFKTDIIVMVYDITNPSSFDYMHMWIETISNLITSPPFAAAIGNKCDLEHQRAVRLDKTTQFVKDNGLASFFISAKTVIEKYTENIRFCIICNYLSKIIPALQSRCTRFRFGPLSPDQILPRLNYVVDEEKLKVSEDGKQALLRLANGDMRKVLNVLQSTWLAYKDVTEDNVYTCVGHPLKSDIENIVQWLSTEDVKTAYNNIKELKTIKGLALNDILSEIHRYVYRIQFPFDLLTTLLDRLAEIEHRLTTGTNENIQLTALICAFQMAKEVNPVDD